MKMDSVVVVYRGNIYFSAELYQTYFRGLESVAMIQRDNDVVLMPLHQNGGGGLLIKIKNAGGDRVIHAREFLASMGIDESREISAPATWDSEIAGLRLTVV